MALNVFFSAISTHLLQNVTAFCGFPASCTITVGQIISIGCAHNCNISERQESNNITAVGSAFLVLAGWPVSAKIAPEIPYHSPHSNLPGVQGVQLCYMQSLENTAFPIPWCEWIGLSLIHDIQWIFIFTVTSSSCQFVNWNTTNRIYFKAISECVCVISLLCSDFNWFFTLFSFCRQFCFSEEKC